MFKRLLAGTALCVVTSAALAADLPVRSAPMAPAPRLAMSWSGFYVGAQIGGATTEAKMVDFDNDRATLSWQSVFVGLHAGYDHQIGNIVLGIEGDVNARFGSSESSLTYFDAIPWGWRSATKWDASVRARLGFLVTDSTLLYATGGVAFANMKLDNPSCRACADWDDINLYGGTRTGWTVGAGIQYALSSNWSLRGEYRYADYGSKRSNYDNGKFATSRINEHRVSFGMSYKFGSPAQAVVARY